MSDDEIRDGFKFRSGSLALDLPASVAARSRAPIDLLATPHDLARWLVAARLATEPPEPTRGELEAARELREALYRLAIATVRGKPRSAGDRAIVNHWAAKPPPALELGVHHAMIVAGTVDRMLAAVAREGVDLLGGPRAPQIRACSGDGCALLFVDTSRSGVRRWCSMAGCGNKAKVASFRRRERDG